MGTEETMEVLRELRIDFKLTTDDAGAPCIYVYGQNIDHEE